MQKSYTTWMKVLSEQNWNLANSNNSITKLLSVLEGINAKGRISIHFMTK